MNRSQRWCIVVLLVVQGRLVAGDVGSKFGIVAVVLVGSIGSVRSARAQGGLAGEDRRRSTELKGEKGTTGSAIFLGPA